MQNNTCFANKKFKFFSDVDDMKILTYCIFGKIYCKGFLKIFLIHNQRLKLGLPILIDQRV